MYGLVDQALEDDVRRGLGLLLQAKHNALADAEDLNALGLTVYRVDSGAAAIEAAQRTRYDLLLLDLCMPGMAGLQTCQAPLAHHLDSPTASRWAATAISSRRRRWRPQQSLPARRRSHARWRLFSPSTLPAHRQWAPFTRH